MTDLNITQRFWYLKSPRRGEANLDPETQGWGTNTDQGFTPEEPSPYGIGPTPLPATEKDAPACLVLLGEPGIGKSTVFRQLSEEAKALSPTVMFRSIRELRDAGGVSALIHEARSKGATLYLDGLDEAVSTQIHGGLVRTLTEMRADTEGLRLRLSARASAWDLELERACKLAFSERDFALVQLAPLRRSDVATAADSLGVSSDEFLAQVDKRSLTTLARIPLTLRMLLSRSPDFGAGWDLYEAGCRQLCHSAGSTQAGKPSEDQRFLIATMIAAAMRLGGTDTLRVEGVCSESEVSLEQIRPLVAAALGESPQASLDESVRSVVQGAALFSSSSYVSRFAHVNYLDFLAAYALHHSRNSTSTLLKILMQGDLVVPQLRVIAGWLAEKREDIAQELLAKDPCSLLLVGVDTLQDPLRVRLVDAVLSDVSRLRTLDPWGGAIRHYHLLSHQTLEEQLSRWIQSEDSSLPSRSEAIRMAVANKCHGLCPLLVDIALSQEKSIHLRARATNALSYLGDNEHYQQIRHLADGLPEDVDEDIRGYTLQALWRLRLITIQELLPLLRYPRSSFYFGGYSRFLSNTLPSHVTIEDLAYVLDWIPSAPWIGRELDSFVCVTIRLTLTNIDLIDDAHARLARALLKLLECDVQFLFRPSDGQAIQGLDQQNRRLLLRELILQTIGTKATSHSWLWNWKRCFLADVTDLDAVLDLCESPVRADERRKLAEVAAALASPMFHPSSEMTPQLTRAYDLSLAYEELREAFSRFFAPMKVDSEQSARARQHYFDHLRCLEQQQAEKAEAFPGISELVKGSLSLSSQQEVWHSLCNRLLTGTHDLRPEFPMGDLAATPAWDTLSPDLKDRTLLEAQEYLESSSPTREALGTYSMNNLYGHIALVTLQSMGGDRRPSIAIVTRWLPVIVHFVGFGEGAAAELDAQLVAAAFTADEDRTTREFVARTRWERSRGNHAWVLSRLNADSSAPLHCPLIALCEENDYSDEFTLDVLRYLLKWGSSAVLKSALSSWHRLAQASTDSSAALNLAITLLLHANNPSAIWDEFWDWIAQSPELQRQGILSLATRTAWATEQAPGELSAKQRLDLCLALERLFPRHEDPRRLGGFSAGPDDHARRLRDNLIAAFVHAGDVESLKLLKSSLGNPDWLDYQIVSAQYNHATSSWSPLTLSQVADFLTPMNSKRGGVA